MKHTISHTHKIVNTEWIHWWEAAISPIHYPYGTLLYIDKALVVDVRGCPVLLSEWPTITLQSHRGLSNNLQNPFSLWQETEYILSNNLDLIPTKCHKIWAGPNYRYILEDLNVSIVHVHTMSDRIHFVRNVNSTSRLNSCMSELDNRNCRFIVPKS